MNKFLVFAFAVTVFAAGVLATAPADRLSKGKIFLQKKATVAAKVEDAKARLLVQTKKLQSFLANPLYDSTSDPSGVKTEVSLVMFTRASSGDMLDKITADSDARAMVNSVTHHCYWNDANKDRVFLNLEDATDSFFGACARTTVRVCGFDPNQDFGLRGNECTIDVGGCAAGDDDIVGGPIHGKTLCNCAVSTINHCRCLFELTPQQASSFCIGDRAPRDF